MGLGGHTSCRMPTTVGYVQFDRRGEEGATRLRAGAQFRYREYLPTYLADTQFHLHVTRTASCLYIGTLTDTCSVCSTYAAGPTAYQNITRVLSIAAAELRRLDWRAWRAWRAFF